MAPAFIFAMRHWLYSSCRIVAHARKSEVCLFITSISFLFSNSCIGGLSIQIAMPKECASLRIYMAVILITKLLRKSSRKSKTESWLRYGSVLRFSFAFLHIYDISSVTLAKQGHTLLCGESTKSEYCWQCHHRHSPSWYGSIASVSEVETDQYH